MAAHNVRYDRLVAVDNLQEWFHQAMTDVLTSQNVSADQQTEHYLVNILTTYTRAENLYEQTRDGPVLKPLALMLEEAFACNSIIERKLILQRLGDIALFIAGFFSQSLVRKSVDIGYYSRMGGTAYAVLYDSGIGTSSRDRALKNVFHELAMRFDDFVGVLNELACAARVFSDKDILYLYELWMHTGSSNVRKLLESFGVQPAWNNRSQRRH